MKNVWLEMVSGGVICLLMAPAALAVPETGSAPITLSAEEILPNDWLAGPNYRVLEDVSNDGLINTYQLQTDYGPITVESTALLVKRIAELRALEKIEEIKKTDTFTEALKSAGKAPFQAMEDLIDEPVDTVKAMGTGIGRWFKDVGQSITSDDPHQPNVLDTAVGQAPVRREFAYEFQVDPYTSYEPLDKELNELAWAGAGGGMTVKAAFSAVGGNVGSALSVSGTAGGMRALVRDKSPAELDSLIEEHFQELGVPASVSEAFLQNTAYNPQERVMLVGEVVGMDGVGNRSLFFSSASRAPDEGVALYMRVRAQLMGWYVAQRDVVRLVEAGSVPFMQTKDGDVVGIFPLDNVRWNPLLEQRLTAIESDLGELPGVKKKVCLILGRVDDAAKEEMAARGWGVLDRQLSRLMQP